MSVLTPEEQAFFDSGGDTRHLGVPDVIPDTPVAAPPPSPVDLAGLGNNDPAPTPVAAPVAAPVAVAPVAPQPVVDQSEFLRQQLAAAQQQAAQLAAALEAAQQQRKAAEPPPPDPDTDPLGSMLHQLDKVNKSVTDIQAEITNQQNQQQQLSAFNRFQAQVQTLRDQFAITAPDFQDAYNHLRNNRLSDLRQLGFDEASASRQVFQEEVALSQAAINQGRNPAESIYEMAKRHGYAKSATAPATPTANAPVPPAQPKLTSIKAGVESSPPNLPRTPGTEEITLESLREASDSDLNRLVSDPAAWSKIAGKDHIPI
jgi:hypothetical protein